MYIKGIYFIIEDYIVIAISSGRLAGDTKRKQYQKSCFTIYGQIFSGAELQQDLTNYDGTQAAASRSGFTIRRKISWLLVIAVASVTSG